MGRAQRDASKPMQVILEASRIRARPKAVETIRLTPSAVAPKAGGTVNAATGPAQAAATTPNVATAVAPAVSTAPAEGTSGTRGLATQDTTARPGVIESAPPTAAGPIRAEPAAAVLRPVEVAPVSAGSIVAAVAASPRVATAAPVVPKLVNLVEPEIPLRLLSRLAKAALFVVGFRINADGSVDQVAIRSGNFKAMESSVLTAVQQWRYQPLPQPHDHTVELVINPPQ